VENQSKLYKENKKKPGAVTVNTISKLKTVSTMVRKFKERRNETFSFGDPEFTKERTEEKEVRIIHKKLKKYGGNDSLIYAILYWSFWTEVTTFVEYKRKKFRVGKSDKNIRYYICDIGLENNKFIIIPLKELQKHTTITNPELLKDIENASDKQMCFYHKGIDKIYRFPRGKYKLLSVLFKKYGLKVPVSKTPAHA
jgi:hypothetical protein